MVCVPIPTGLPEEFATLGLSLCAFIWTVFQHFHHKKTDSQIENLTKKIAEKAEEKKSNNPINNSIEKKEVVPETAH